MVNRTENIVQDLEEQKRERERERQQNERNKFLIYFCVENFGLDGFQMFLCISIIIIITLNFICFLNFDSWICFAGGPSYPRTRSNYNIIII